MMNREKLTAAELDGRSMVNHQVALYGEPSDPDLQVWLNDIARRGCEYTEYLDFMMAWRPKGWRRPKGKNYFKENMEFRK